MTNISAFCTLLRCIRMENASFLATLLASTKSELIVGEPWCIISMEWWKMVLEAVEEGADDAELPDVDNLNLCDNSDQEEGEHVAVLRTGLKEGIDYTLVPYGAWQAIHTRFVHLLKLQPPL